MKSNLKWTAAVAMLLAALLHLPLAYGQVRTTSGASPKSSGILHPKELERRILQSPTRPGAKTACPRLIRIMIWRSKARAKSDDMLMKKYFSHTSPEGKTLKDHFQEEKPASFQTISRIGENIYVGARFDYSNDMKTQARMIVDGWMTSPGHRKNILYPNYTHLGVGVAAKGKMCYATQIFSQVK